MKIRTLMSAAIAVSITAASSITVLAAEDSYSYLAGQRQNSSASQHLDAEALVAAGVIDQATADSIAAYAFGKHDKIHGRYDNMANLMPEERHTHYASFESDDFEGDCVVELLSADVITQEQADAINEYLG